MAAVKAQQYIEQTFEVMGSNPVGCWAFSLSTLSFQLSILYLGPSRKCNITSLEVKQA